MSIETLPENLQKALRRELEGDERVRWVAQPVPRLLAWKARKMVLFGLGWAAFSAYLAIVAIYYTKSPFLFGISLILILIGLLLLASPLFLFGEARRTAYAVTSRRAIIACKGKRMKIRSFYPRQFKEIHKTRNEDGSGDLLFAGMESSDAPERYFGLTGFEAIADADAAERALRALLSEAFDKDTSPSKEEREF